MTEPTTPQQGSNPVDRTHAGAAEVAAVGPLAGGEEVGRKTARLASAGAVRQIIGTGLLAVTAAIVARSLGASSFGVYAAATAAYNLAVTLTDLGFGVVAAREMAKHPSQEAPLLRATVQVQFAWSVLITLGLVGDALATGGSRGQAMLVLCPAVLISGLAAARQIFIVRYLPVTIVLVDISAGVIQAGAMITLALVGAGVLAIAGALSAAVCLNVLAAVALARRLIDRGRPAGVDRWRILRMALPIGVASVLASLYFTIDQVLLTFLVSARQLGEYAAAVRLLSALVMVPGFVMAAGIPGLATRAHDRVRLSQLIGKLAHWLSVTALPLAVGLAVFAQPIVHFVFGSSYQEAVGLLRVLMTAGVLTIVSNLLGITLLSLSIVRTMVIFNIVSLVINVVGNLVLVPLYGVAASAWLTTGSELIVISYAILALQPRVSYRTLLMPVARPLIAVCIGAVVGVLLGADDLPAMAGSAAAFLVVLFALRGWPPDLLPGRLRQVSLLNPAGE